MFVFALPVATDFTKETDHQQAEDLLSNETIMKVLHGRRRGGGRDINYWFRIAMVIVMQLQCGNDEVMLKEAETKSTTCVIKTIG